MMPRSQARAQFANRAVTCTTRLVQDERAHIQVQNTGWNVDWSATAAAIADNVFVLKPEAM